jgi:hypothetical protein
MRREGALEIHRSTGHEPAEIGPVERLAEKIESERTGVVRRDGQTATIDGDAVAEPHILRDQRRAQREPGSGGRAIESEEFASFFNQACEHDRRR